MFFFVNHCLFEWGICLLVLSVDKLYFIGLHVQKPESISKIKRENNRDTKEWKSDKSRSFRENSNKQVDNYFFSASYSCVNSRQQGKQYLWTISCFILTDYPRPHALRNTRMKLSSPLRLWPSRWQYLLTLAPFCHGQTWRRLASCCHDNIDTAKNSLSFSRTGNSRNVSRNAGMFVNILNKPGKASLLWSP